MIIHMYICTITDCMLKKNRDSSCPAKCCLFEYTALKALKWFSRKILKMIVMYSIYIGMLFVTVPSLYCYFTSCLSSYRTGFSTYSYMIYIKLTSSVILHFIWIDHVSIYSLCTQSTNIYGWRGNIISKEW